MSLQIGDRLPAATFYIATPDGPKTTTTDEVFKGHTVVLFAVPGAFTPTCHKNHLPGYIANAEKFKQKGIDKIAVTAVNDVFVMQAWAKATGGEAIVEFLGDGNGDFAKAVGMELDGSGFGLGLRSKRYSMLVKDGVVAWLAVEEAPGKADLSGAEAMLAAI